MTIRSVADSHLKHLKIDAKFAKDLMTYENHYLNSNPNNLAAMGSNLLGVYPMRFTTSDRYAFLEDLLGVDANAMRKDIISLPTVDEEWVRATDVMNILCMYLAYRFHSSALPQKVKEEGAMSALMIYHYKIFSSLLTRYFPHGVSEGLAQAVYAKLTKKFDIKQAGNWKGVLKRASQQLLSNDSIHKDTFKTFQTDEKVVYLISDSQLRVRSRFKYIWTVLDEVHSQGKGFVNSSSNIELNGEMHLRDVERLIPKYTRYIKDVLTEQNRFIKEDLIAVVLELMPTIPEKQFQMILTVFVTRYKAGDKLALSIVETTITHLFDSVLSDREVRSSLGNLTETMIRTRGLYTASRSSDALLLKMRDEGEKFIRKNTSVRNAASVSANRTGILLYLVLRAIVIDHYA